MTGEPTRPIRPAEALSGFGLSPELEVDVAVRLSKGAIEYGDLSLTRTRAELLGEMYEEALDLIGWAAVHVCAEDRQHGADAGIAAALSVAPMVRQAAMIAVYLDGALRTLREAA